MIKTARVTGNGMAMTTWDPRASARRQLIDAPIPNIAYAEADAAAGRAVTLLNGWP